MIMAKVRTIQVKNVGNVYTAFVYRGYYCIKGGERAFHTPNILRNNSCVDDIVEDDEFNMAHDRFDTPEFFKEVVDEHIEYAERSHGSLRKYLRAMMGDF